MSTTQDAIPFDAAEVEAIRAQLPAARRLAYLNAGTLGPMPQVAIDAIAAEQSLDATERQGADLWDRLTQAQDAARDVLGSLTGVEPERVALMHSTHEGVNACLWGLELSTGDNLVTTDEEHPGLLVPMRHVRDRRGAEPRIAAWGADDEAFVANVLAQVDQRTRAVAISHVSWVSGRIAPLRMLRDALPSDVRLIVDGAQSAGILPVDPTDGWDAYTVSGQKWPCGPNGSGGLALLDPEAWLPTYGAYLQLTDPLDAFASAIAPSARRFEQSQEAIGPLRGFAAGAGWLTSDVGVPRARAHARVLNARARERFAAGGFDPARLLGDEHLLVVRGLEDAPAVSAALLEAGFLQRYLTPTSLRLSFGCWNTPAEVDGCVDALLEHG